MNDELPISDSEPDRLAALESYKILDTPPEPGFDDIVEITAAVCDVPFAVVSLVAESRQWFKARRGIGMSETDLSLSVCRFVLSEPDVLVIPDLAQDPRTRSNPLVTDAPGIRFYAGAPLRTAEGHAIGSLCAIDTRPRPEGLSARQSDVLRCLARQVVAQLDLRRALIERDRLAADLQAASVRRSALLSLGDHLRDQTTIAEMTRSASAIVGKALGLVRAGFGILEHDDEWLRIESDWTAEGETSAAGLHRFADYGDLFQELAQGEPLVIADVTTDPRTAADPGPLLAMNARAIVNLPVREKGRTVAIFLVHDRQPRAWTPETLAFLRNVADRVEMGVARLKAEADQRVLNEELSHRMKNSFAMVQAIAAQTLRLVPDQVPVAAFNDRLYALSAAHDILLKQSWLGADLGVVLRTVLSAVAQIERFDIAPGPDVAMGSRSTLSLSLLLHELATNAAKYGSLSVPEGHVAIGWSIETGDEGPELILTWLETGGPPAAAPLGRGFGTRLIKMGLIGSGGADIRYTSSGVAAVFRAPLDQIQQS